MKLRLLRSGDVLADDDILVRGGALEPAVLRDDALRYHRVYGSYGISVLASRHRSVEQMAQHSTLVRFGRLVLVEVTEVRKARLALEPTGRNPDHYTISFEALGGVARLVRCRHRIVTNPYFDR